MKKQTNKRKALIIVLAAIVIVAISVGTTLALLMDTTSSVTNTFTVGDINITLEETVDPDTFKMVPGNVIAKDPIVTVEGGSEACYLFIKVDEANNIGSDSGATFVEWAVDSGWTQGDGTNIPANVWYRTVTASDSDQEFVVLTDKSTGSSYPNGSVKVGQNITKADLEGAKTSAPTLTFTAGAVQQANVASAAAAWAQIASLFA